MQKIRLIKLAFVLPVAFLFLSFPLWAGQYPVHLAIWASLGCFLALGTNITFGYCGQINFGVIFMYALGAYSSAILQLRLGIHFFLALPLACLLTTVATAIVCIPLLRLRGHNLALGTFSLALVTYTVIGMWRNVTGGSDGMFVPATVIFQHEMGDTFYYYFILSLLVLAFIGCERLVSSSAGRAMMAIREDEVAAVAFGINVTRYRRLAFMLNGLLVGLGGVLFGQWNEFLAPSYFDLWMNILIVVMIVFGGLGSNRGSIVGGATIMLLPEALAVFEVWHVLVYGAILLLTLGFMPKGLYVTLASLTRRLRGDILH